MIEVVERFGHLRKCGVVAQGLGLVFVAVYQRALKLLYVDNLLEAVKQEFADSYFKPKQYDYPKFEATYKRLLAEAEARADAALRDRSNARAFQGKKVFPQRKAKGCGWIDCEAFVIHCHPRCPSFVAPLFPYLFASPFHARARVRSCMLARGACKASFLSRHVPSGFLLVSYLQSFPAECCERLHHVVAGRTLS